MSQPPKLGHAERVIIKDMAGRRDRIAHGEVRVIRVYKHPVDGDERVIVQPMIVSVKTAPAESWPGVIAEKRHVAGQLWVTQRRAILAHRSEIKQVWRWADTANVAVIPDYSGVAVTPRDGGAVAVIEKFNPDPAVARRLTPVRRWLTVTATFAFASGRLDEWYAELPRRIASMS